MACSCARRQTQPSSLSRISLGGSEPSLVQAAAGQAVQLFCPGNTYPQFQAGWQKDGEAISSDRCVQNRGPTSCVRGSLWGSGEQWLHFLRRAPGIPWECERTLSVVGLFGLLWLAWVPEDSYRPQESRGISLLPRSGTSYSQMAPSSSAP